MENRVLNVSEALARVRCPAVSVAAVVGEEVVCLEAAGQVNGQVASAESTVFLSASISKTFLAVMCMQCVENGEIELDIDIRSYTTPHSVKPWNPYFPELPITVRQLLQHKAGLRDDESALLPGPFRTEGADSPITLQQYVQRRLCRGGSDFKPWIWSSTDPARYHYSNAGFTLLGFVVECATGRSLPDLAQDRIFDVLKMSTTTYTLEAMRALDGISIAEPHTHKGPVGHYGVAEWPSAQIRSTSSDLAKYLVAFTGP